MIKAWLATVLILILFAMAYALDLFAILGTNLAFYIAFALVVIMLTIARIILGNPLNKDEKDEEDNE